MTTHILATNSVMNNLHSILAFTILRNIFKMILLLLFESCDLQCNRIRTMPHTCPCPYVCACACVSTCVRVCSNEMRSDWIIAAGQRVWGPQGGAVSTERRRVFDVRAAYGASELKWERFIEGAKPALNWGFSAIACLTAVHRVEHAPALYVPVRVRTYRPRAMCHARTRRRRTCR